MGVLWCFPGPLTFFPVREIERAGVYISVGRLALRLVNPSRAKVTSEQNNRCQWKRGQNLVAPITVRKILPCLTLNTLAAWHQRIKLNEFDGMIKNCMHIVSRASFAHDNVKSPFWILILSRITCAIYIHVDGIPSILVMKQLASFAWHLWGVFSLGWTPLSIFISAVGLDQFRPGCIALLSADEPDLGDPKIRMATEQNLLVFFQAGIVVFRFSLRLTFDRGELHRREFDIPIMQHKNLISSWKDRKKNDVSSLTSHKSRESFSSQEDSRKNVWNCVGNQLQGLNQGKGKVVGPCQNFLVPSSWRHYIWIATCRKTHEKLT